MNDEAFPSSARQSATLSIGDRALPGAIVAPGRASASNPGVPKRMGFRHSAFNGACLFRAGLVDVAGFQCEGLGLDYVFPIGSGGLAGVLAGVEGLGARFAGRYL